jgi:hypothetical protein
VATEFTVPQLVALYFRDQADGWQTVGLGDALEWAKRKEAEKAAAKAGDTSPH